MDTSTVFVPGPLHPDLFGGETPIMVPVEGRVWRVRMTWTEVSSDTFTVLASSEDEAEEFAGDLISPVGFGGDVDDIECEDIEELDGSQADERMVARYKKWRAEKEAAERRWQDERRALIGRPRKEAA